MDEGVYIQSAFYGDENAMQDVTKLLGNKVVGTRLDIPVDENLIPPFTVAEKTELDPQDIARIREQASKNCGGVDQECIAATESRLRQERLTEKERLANSAIGVIKGRRLTLNVRENGKLVRKVIPDGQKLSLENVSVTDPRNGKTQLPPLKYFQNQLFIFGTVVLATFVYVFSIIAVYTIFAPRMGLPVAIPLTVIAFFIPYSGYLIIFFYFMFVSLVKTYVAT
jgi:hypothetical protein